MYVGDCTVKHIPTHICCCILTLQDVPQAVSDTYEGGRGNQDRPNKLSDITIINDPPYHILSCFKA